MKIIRKIPTDRKLYLVLDTETANGFGDPMVYDFGFALVDAFGTVYAVGSYVVRNIFYWQKGMMKTAFYADKIPQYREDIANGSRQVVNLEYIRKVVCSLCEKYDCALCAHNHRFDYRALTATQRYTTKSANREFFPSDVEFVDTLNLAKSLLENDREYYVWCFRHNALTKNDKPRFTAEILYRYITGEDDFVESHTGFEDVMIEKEILRYCMERM